MEVPATERRRCMETTPIAESLLFVPCDCTNGEHNICLQMLTQAMQKTIEDQAYCLENVIILIVNMRLNGLVEEMSSGEPVGKKKAVPWTRRRIAQGEKVQAEFEKRAVEHLRSILILKPDATDVEAYSALAVAMAYLWGFTAQAYLAVRDTLPKKSAVLGPPHPPHIGNSW